MRLKHLTLLPLISVCMIACEKDLKQPVNGYFFIQQTPDEEHSLFINDQFVGNLTSTTVVPNVDEDSTLSYATISALKHKKNDYVLKNASDQIVAKGSFKFQQNGMKTTSIKDFGGTYMSSTEEAFIMGFNVKEAVLDHDPGIKEL